MSDKTAWMKRFAEFQGRVNQLVAEDIYEHGEAQEDRDVTFQDVRQLCVEVSAMAFELYTAAVKIEEVVAAAYLTAADSIRLYNETSDDEPS